MPVHATNAEAVRAWDGGDGAYWAGSEAAFDVGLERNGGPLFEAAALAS